MITKQSRIPIAVALILIGITINAALKFNQEIHKRIESQNRLISIAQTWNDEIEAMRPLEKQWEKQLPTSTLLTSEYNIIKHIHIRSYGMDYLNENITISPPSPITHAQHNIGIHFYPVSNFSNNEMRLTAPDTLTAWNAAQQLQKRPDIRFTRVRLEMENNRPLLTLENFGLIARVETQ